MIFGKKHIAIKFKNDDNNSIEKIESANIKAGGNSFFYRVGESVIISDVRVEKGITSEDMIKIKINLPLFCEEKNIEELDLFYKGEKYTVDNNNTLYVKKFPIKDIVVLMMYDKNITEITNLCSVDKISGIVKIPENISGLCSLIYNIKTVKVYNVKNKEVKHKGFGIERVII